MSTLGPADRDHGRARDLCYTVRIHMANAASLFDKYAVIQKLQKRGFTHEQAEGIAEVLANTCRSSLVASADASTLRKHCIVRPGASSA
jgi:hypothetical protein